MFRSEACYPNVLCPELKSPNKSLSHELKNVFIFTFTLKAIEFLIDAPQTQFDSDNTHKVVTMIP